MGHDHSHDHDHVDCEVALPPALDMSIPDEALPPAEQSRRSFLSRAGVLGVAAATTSVLGTAGQAAAVGSDDPGQIFRRLPRGGFQWLAGDHHIHTRYSPDAQYRVIDQVRHAHAYGLDWMVITDHGSVQHAKIGVEKVNPDIVAARAAIPDTLVFQGLEWNIPAAEHGTVFVHPGNNEVAVLKEFENAYDGTVTNTGASTPTNEALATAGIIFLADAVTARRVADALMLANHPARKGIDSPHEIRAWRDAAPRIAIGMEGAPGHQAAGIAKPNGPGSGRGFYDNSPTPASFPGYPLESYRTFGGFDWMTTTVGGLWDSLLAEGKPWWITANSDSHMVYGDTSIRGPGSDFTTNGFFNDPRARWPSKSEQRRLLARFLQPYQRRRHQRLLRRRHGRTAGRPGVGGPRPADLRPERAGARRPVNCPEYAVGWSADRTARHLGATHHRHRPGQRTELGPVPTHFGPGRRDRRRRDRSGR